MRYSFAPIGTHTGATVYRTIISRSDPINNDEDFKGLVALINACHGKPWIWIIDCQDMQMSHCLNLSYVWQLYNLLHDHHQDSLQRIWIMNVNSWIQMIMGLLASVKVDVLPMDRLELFLELQKRRVPTALANQMLFTPPAACQDEAIRVGAA